MSFRFLSDQSVHCFILRSNTLICVAVPCASRSNSSCAECLQNVSVSQSQPAVPSVTINTSGLMFVVFLLLQCLWCAPSSRCIDYPVGSIVPPRSLCPLNDARWGVCWGKTTSNKSFSVENFFYFKVAVWHGLYEIKFGLKLLQQPL